MMLRMTSPCMPITSPAILASRVAVYEVYGEPGALTDPVRRKPYCIVLLDEVEKAHPDVQELFYQVFDKGMLSDSSGNDINFKNTIIILTSNVGTDTVMKLCADPDTRPGPEALAEAMRPDLLKAFKPALSIIETSSPAPAFAGLIDLAKSNLAL
jgi:ATP-dependent Clp protease ATP-binding subunit ClpA